MFLPFLLKFPQKINWNYQFHRKLKKKHGDSTLLDGCSSSHPSAIPTLNPNRTFGEATSAMSFHDIEGNLFLRRHLSMFFWGWAKALKIWTKNGLKKKKHDFFRQFFWGWGGDVVNGGFCRDWYGGWLTRIPNINQAICFFFGSNWNGMEWNSNSGIYTPLNWSTTKTDWIKHFPTKVNHQTQLLFSGWTL